MQKLENLTPQENVALKDVKFSYKDGSNRIGDKEVRFLVGEGKEEMILRTGQCVKILSVDKYGQNLAYVKVIYESGYVLLTSMSPNHLSRHRSNPSFPDFTVSILDIMPLS